MAKQIIQVGTIANDKTGDPLRTAFTKINQNFTELYSADTANLGNFKISGSTLATQGATANTWGDSAIYLDPMGEGDNWIYIPNSTQANTGSRFELKGVQGVNLFAGNTGMKWQFYNDEGTPTLELPNDSVDRYDAAILHRHGDLNITTLRTSYGIDCDIGLNAADDLWLNANGDQVEITAANVISIISGTSSMSQNEWSVTNATWNGTTLTFETSDTGAINELGPYLGSTGRNLWFEIQDGGNTRWVEVANNTVIDEVDPNVFQTTVNTSSDGTTYQVLNIKLEDLNYNGSKQWNFERNGSLTLPSGGTLGLEGMGWPGFSNGTTEQPVSIVYKTNTGNWQAAISLYGGNDEDGLGSINLFTSNAVTSNTYGWTFTENGAVTFPTLTVPISDNANPSGTGQTLKFGDASQQAIIYGPESTSGNNSAERIIIQGAPGFTGTSGEGGDVYVWAGPGGDANGNGGDIKVRAGQGDGSGAGGYLNFQAGDSSTGNGGYINIESGQSNTYGSGGDITIWAHDGGDIKLRTHNNLTSLDWIFKADGSLQSPAGSLGILKTVQNVSTGGLPAIDIIGNVVFADANAADDHITLLLPQSPPTGAEVTVKNINSGGFSVNVLASTDDSVAIEALDGTISTSTSGVLYGNCHATWVFDGSTWRITNRFTT